MLREIFCEPLLERFSGVAALNLLSPSGHLVEDREQNDMAVIVAESECALGVKGMANHISVRECTFHCQSGENVSQHLRPTGGTLLDGISP
jgi:hypothetical protein